MKVRKFVSVISVGTLEKSVDHILSEWMFAD